MSSIEPTNRLDKIQPLDTPTDSSKTSYLKTLETINLDKQELELVHKADLHKLKLSYAIIISIFVAIITFVILIMIYRSANEANWFNIPTAVQITLAGSAFASTLGLILAIIRGMFRNSPNLPKK